ncbi:MAG: type I glyceraldehyde-3-phosphate dehydrogenase [Candidatus Dependentiae bacterium]|nr:type I glyceraldehyde-3-phosphate dehydrogenase [Candidatus Dependentiae bacterium]
MALRIAINGFGRIGRTFLRVLLQEAARSQRIEVIAINLGPMDPAILKITHKYDTTMRTFSADVAMVDGHLLVGGHRIKILATTDVDKLAWRELDIDWVVDCTGRFTEPGAARAHLTAGAKRVLISAPAAGADCTIIPGVNDAAYRPDCAIVSLGSCTTNALMPLLKVLQEHGGIESATVVTIHAYTATQALLDGGAVSPKDLRRHRAAPMNIVPSTTGAEKMVGLVLPALAGKVSAVSVRVPVPDVSFLEVSWVSPRELVREAVDGWFDAAAASELKPYLTVTREQLVSSDFIGDEHSVVYDATMTIVAGRLGTVFGWYDNEWGYCCRMRDFLASHA